MSSICSRCSPSSSVTTTETDLTALWICKRRYPAHQSRMASLSLARFSADFITRMAGLHDRCTFAALQLEAGICGRVAGSWLSTLPRPFRPQPLDQGSEVGTDPGRNPGRSIFAQPDMAAVWSYHERIVEQLQSRFVQAAAWISLIAMAAFLHIAEQGASARSPHQPCPLALAHDLHGGCHTVVVWVRVVDRLSRRNAGRVGRALGAGIDGLCDGDRDARLAWLDEPVLAGWHVRKNPQVARLAHELQPL